MVKHSIKIAIISLGITFLLASQQFRITRPVKDKIQTNGSYLYGEPRYQNPSLAHLGIDISIVYDTIKSASNGVVYSIGYNPNDTIGGYEPGGATILS